MTEQSAASSRDPDRYALPDLCEPFLTALPVTGASVTVVTASGARMTLCTTDPVAARIDALQFELGEGPQLLATRSGEFVTIADVAEHPHHEWPVFGAALHQLPVGALFCVPIRMGAVTLGVATLHCTLPRRLTTSQQLSATAIASAIAGSVAQRALQTATEESPIESASTPALRREVHQATGMVLVQLGSSATVAFSRMQAYAFANGRTIEEVARDVVAGLLTFEDAADPQPGRGDDDDERYT